MQHPKPAWWQLVLLVPIMFGLLALEHVTPFPGMSDADVDAGILILTFAALLLWLQQNAGRLEWYYVDRDRASSELRITIYEPAAQTPSVESADQPPLSMARSRVPERSRIATSRKDDDKSPLN